MTAGTPHTDAAAATCVGIDDRPTAAPAVDAVLLVSFGGPEGPDDVAPFLANVTRGRDIPADRLAEVGRHYLDTFGGVSPINEQARALRAALERELAERGPRLPVYWGTRNAAPSLTETLRRMRDDGIAHALAVVTSAYPSYSGCRQYREDIWRARLEVGAGAPLVTKLRHYYADDGFLAPFVEGVQAALDDLGEHARLVFCAHSIPTAAAAASGPDGDGYVTALRWAAAHVVARLSRRPAWDLVWQSRSGSPRVPWLEPDVGDHLDALYRDGVREVVLVPIGFTSDHVEVLFDLDIQAQERVAARPGMRAVRAPTPGADPGFVAMLRDLVVERIAGPELPCHGAPATHDRCPAHCCLTAAR